MGEKIYKPIVKDGDHLIRSKDNPDRVRIRKDCKSQELCIERQKEAEMFLSEKVAAGLDQLLSNESLRLDLNTSRELFSLTGGGVRLNGEYVPMQAMKIDEALRAISISEQEKCI